jgi:hypothetical protein
VERGKGKEEARRGEGRGEKLPNMALHSIIQQVPIWDILLNFIIKFCIAAIDKLWKFSSCVHTYLQ